MDFLNLLGSLWRRMLISGIFHTPVDSHPTFGVKRKGIGRRGDRETREAEIGI